MSDLFAVLFNHLIDEYVVCVSATVGIFWILNKHIIFFHVLMIERERSNQVNTCPRVYFPHFSSYLTIH